MITTSSTEHRRHITDDEFLALLCADEELLRAEFDAIIAASWPDPPARLPWRGAGGEPPGDGQGLHEPRGASGPPTKPCQPHVDPSSRQRSPPIAAAEPTKTKGR